jgi:hypothetical protein
MDRNPNTDREQFNEQSAKRRFAEQRAHIKQNPKKDVRGEFDHPGETSPSTSEKAEGS